MTSILNFLRDNKGYLPMFVLGTLVSLPYSVEEIHGSLETVGILMLAALFASLLLAFAGLSQTERVNKWILQNAPLAAFGAYFVEVAKQPTAVKILLMLCAMGMHLSYWNASIHSREFRLNQYKLGFSTDLPATTKLIACLNGTGRSELGDALVQGMLQQCGVSEKFWASIPQHLHHLVEPAKTEYMRAVSHQAERVVVVS